jgi:hypothetical protein
MASTILETRHATTAEALAFFDRLETVDLQFMTGRWKGSEIRTGHPMDGWLEASGWFGKEFVDPETVHPLLFSGANRKIVKVAPTPQAMRSARHLPWLRHPSWRPLLRLGTSLMHREASQARLRMVEIRGRLSATMIYDHLPILDAFRKIDARTVLGLMDEKGQPQPYVFLLKRC